MNGHFWDLVDAIIIVCCVTFFGVIIVPWFGYFSSKITEGPFRFTIKYWDWCEKVQKKWRLEK